MASTRRTARTLLAGACVVPLLAVPGVAQAAPPEHASAHGQSQGAGASQGRADDRPAGQRRTASVTESQGHGGSSTTRSPSGKPDTAGGPAATDRGRGGPPAHADRGRGGPSTQDDGATRSTASAGSTSTSTSSSPDRGGAGADRTGTDDRPGRGLGRTAPPGRATDEGGGRQASGGASTPATSPTPSTPSPGPAAGPAAGDPAGAADAPEAAVPVPPPSFAVATPTPAPPPPAGDAPQAPAESPAAPSTTLDLDQRLQALLDDVTGPVRRTVPNVLGTVPEPLSDLVPTLLLILGAFLVVQRGIGRGLGHVPMAGGTGPRDTSRS